MSCHSRCIFVSERRTFGNEAIIAIGACDTVQGVIANIVPGAVGSSGSLGGGSAEDGGDGAKGRGEDGDELHYQESEEGD